MFRWNHCLFLVLIKDNIPDMPVHSNHLHKEIPSSDIVITFTLIGHRKAWFGELDMLICPLITGTFIKKASTLFII